MTTTAVVMTTATTRARPGLGPSPVRPWSGVDRRDPGGQRARTGGAVRGARQPAVVYRRRRRVALGLVVALGLAGWLGVHDLVARADGGLGPTQDIAARVVIVRPGDTLWTIAARSGAHGDIRALVDELSAEVHGRALQVGERIEVP